MGLVSFFACYGTFCNNFCTIMDIMENIKTYTPVYFIKKVLICLLILIPVSIFIMNLTSVRAEDNKTIEFTDRGWPKILEEDKWRTQMIFDTVQTCYQGTIRWIVLSNPSLLGQIPNPLAMRQMMEHCFCVMDKIRKENKVKDYSKKVKDPEWGGNLFMLKAMECVGEYKTLPSFFKSIIETPSDNSTEVPKGETEDSKEESPDQPKEESEGAPQTIFQG